MKVPLTLSCPSEVARVLNQKDGKMNIKELKQGILYIRNTNYQHIFLLYNFPVYALLYMICYILNKVQYLGLYVIISYFFD